MSRLTLTPLTCPKCTGPCPLADAAETPCPFCGERVAIPAEYRALLAAERAHAAEATKARSLYEVLGRPPRWLYRFLAGWFSPGSLAVGMFPASFLFGIAIVYGALWLLSFVLPVNLLDVMPEQPGLWAAVITGLVFVWTGALVGVAGTRRALALGALQAALAAKPPEREGGVASCRLCGAPLTYGPADLGVRCAYCRTDNLLQIPPAWVRRVERLKATVDKAIESVEAALEQELARLRRYRRGMALGLAVPSVLSLLMFSQELNRPSPARGWALATQGDGHVFAVTAEHDVKKSELWYSTTKPVPLDGGAASLELQTTGPYCGAGFCRVDVQLAAHRGERWQVQCTPADAAVSVEVHDGYANVTESWQREWPGRFGPTVASGRCGEGVTVEVTRTGWHLVVVQLDARRRSGPSR